MPYDLDFNHDAPISETDAVADVTDVYAFIDPAPTESGALPTLFHDLAGGGPDGTTGDTSGESFDLASEDSFHFLLSGPGTGTAVPDGSTPAPPEEEQAPPEFGIEWEMENLTSARHTATGAMLRMMLVYG